MSPQALAAKPPALTQTTTPQIPTALAQAIDHLAALLPYALSRLEDLETTAQLCREAHESAGDQSKRTAMVEADAAYRNAYAAIAAAQSFAATQIPAIEGCTICGEITPLTIACADGHDRCPHCYDAYR